MILRGIEFGNIWGASGVQGFFGEGYWFHRFLRPFGLDFNGMTFVAKTSTLSARPGNMPLKEDYTPRECLPQCMVVKPWKGVALNSVGLSGPGARALFEKGLWQQRRRPFFISFMSVSGNRRERMQELSRFVAYAHDYIHRGGFNAPVGLQINYSCPNVGLHLEELVDEVRSGLNLASDLDIPLVPKFNMVLPPHVATEIAAHHACDAICTSNTIPWGQLPELIDWEGLFGTTESPLAHLGGGGLSGTPLLPLLIDWIKCVRKAGLKKPLNAGGGILSMDDGMRVFEAGAESIFLGSIAFLRPWRVRGIIRAFK